MTEKVWTDDMGEISGFGGGYEDTCRRMLFAGVKWLEEHPDAEISFRGFEGVFGLAIDNSPDAELLSKAITSDEVCGEGGCTGAMHHAVINHLRFIKDNGWDKYCSELRDRPARNE